MGACDPPAVDRELAAYELDVGWLTVLVGGKGALKGRDNLRRLADSLRVQAQFGNDLGHINIVMPQHNVGVGVVPPAYPCRQKLPLCH